MTENTTFEQMDSRELLAQIARYQKKEVGHARLNTVVGVLVAAVLLVTLLVVLPRAVTVLDHMEQSLQEIDTFVESADRVVADNSGAVTDALGKLNGVDFDTLNEAIQDLSDAVKPLANFARMFNKG